MSGRVELAVRGDEHVMVEEMCKEISSGERRKGLLIGIISRQVGIIV